MDISCHWLCDLLYIWKTTSQETSVEATFAFELISVPQMLPEWIDPDTSYSSYSPQVRRFRSSMGWFDCSPSSYSWKGMNSRRIEENMNSGNRGFRCFFAVLLNYPPNGSEYWISPWRQGSIPHQGGDRSNEQHGSTCSDWRYCYCWWRESKETDSLLAEAYSSFWFCCQERYLHSYGSYDENEFGVGWMCWCLMKWI